MGNPVVDEYEVLYRETRNPLFVWEALEICQRDAPLPGWIFDYFSGCARSLCALGQPAWNDVPREQIESRHLGVLDLADRVCNGTLDPATAAGLSSRALAFKRGAKDNAFSELAQLRLEFQEAWFVDVTRAGTKQEAAKFELETRDASRRGSKPRNVTGSKSQIERHLARARRLLRAQRRDKD